jgi:tight adherence protein B
VAAAAGATPVLLLLLVVVVGVGVRGWLAVRIGRRRRAFEEQLPELLTELGSALRAGHSFTQALQAVTADAPKPTAQEFGRALAETRLGRPLEDALASMSKRIQSRQLEFVLDAVVVQRQVGGSLAGIFAIVGETVRQRQQCALRLRSLTATGRVSAIVLIAMPLGLAGLLSIESPGYLDPLLRSSGGREVLAISIGMLVVGAFWLRAIVSPHGGSA